MLARANHIASLRIELFCLDKTCKIVFHAQKLNTLREEKNAEENGA